MENLIQSRVSILSTLKKEDFDIVIIGGGVTGAGVARDAVLRGFKVALLEKGDFGSGTSSMTSKMLHGGLRYLKNYEFRLVRQATLERKVHLDIAPHLTERMQFLVPLYKWSEEGKIMRRLGLLLYDLLAFPKGIGKRKHLGKEGMIEKLPLLANDDLIGGSLYFDCKTDDARLTLANILSAIAGGGSVINYCQVKKWKVNNNGIEVIVEDIESNDNFTVHGKVIILCAGPWSELVEEKGDNFNGKAKLFLSRGTHLLMKPKLKDHPCLIVNDDGRPIFLIPRIDYDLAGTTDIVHQGNPDNVTPTVQEVDYIINACNKLFPTVKYTKNDIVACISGVRPLVYQKGADARKTSREHSIFVDSRGVITLVGGKLTTYRVMAKEALDKAIKILKLSKKDHRCVTDNMPLWGGEIEDWENFYQEESRRIMKEYNLSESTARMLVKWYGSELIHFEEFLSKYGTDPLKEGRPWLDAQVIYSCQVEMARTPIDFLGRRTPLMLEEGNGLDVLEKVVEIMGKELDWDEETSNRMTNLYNEYFRKFIAIPNG